MATSKKTGRYVTGQKFRRGGTRLDTPENKAGFLDALGETCSITIACEAIGVGRASVYGWRNKDPEFAKQWDDMKATRGADTLEDEAVRRGVHGVEEPVFHQGQPTGQWVDKEGRLLRQEADGVWVYLSNGKKADPESVSFRRNIVRKYSDTMLAMLLNGAKPEKYRQRHDHSGSVTVKFTKEDEGVL
jgi:hypothetical protein